MATFCKFKVFLQCLLCGRPEKKETVENREIFFTTGGSSGNSLCWCTCHYNRDNPKATFYTPISELNQDQRGQGVFTLEFLKMGLEYEKEEIS